MRNNGICLRGCFLLMCSQFTASNGSSICLTGNLSAQSDQINLDIRRAIFEGRVLFMRKHHSAELMKCLNECIDSRVLSLNYHC